MKHILVMAFAITFGQFAHAQFNIGGAISGIIGGNGSINIGGIGINVGEIAIDLEFSGPGPFRCDLKDSMYQTPHHGVVANTIGEAQDSALEVCQREVWYGYCNNGTYRCFREAQP